MIFAVLLPYQIFQLRRYGNIMPEHESIFPQDEDDYRQNI